MTTAAPGTPAPGAVTRRRGAPRINQYELDIEIGRGGFGKVHLATDIKTGRKVAVKIVNKEMLASTDTESYFLREAAMSQQLQHPNIVKAIELIDHYKVYALVMELAPGGELFDKIIERKRFDEKTARKYFQELCSAVACLHANGIVHRDLKAENMLVGEEGELKICDLGLARYTRAKLSGQAVTPGKTAEDDEEILFMSLAGSPDYVAPEVISPKGYRGNSCDYWSMGVILYFCLCGYLPFYSMAKEERVKQAETRERILAGEFNANSRYLTPQAADLIKIMLTVDPDKRATIEQIIDHPWTQVDLSDELKESISKNIKKKGASEKDNELRKSNLSMVPQTTAASNKEAFTDPDVYKLVQKAFRSCNVGGGGKLTRTEVRDVLIKLNKGNPVPEEEVDQFLACFKLCDPSSKTGEQQQQEKSTNSENFEVSEDEFTQGWSQLGPYLQKKGIPIERLADMFSFDLESKLVAELRQIFDELDIDNSGVISLENLMGIEQLGLNGEQAHQLLDVMDVDKTKTITFENFVTAVTKSDSLQKHPLVSRLQRIDKMFKVLEQGTQSTMTISSGFTVAGFREQIVNKLFNEAEEKISTRFNKPEGVSVIQPGASGFFGQSQNLPTSPQDAGLMSASANSSSVTPMKNEDLMSISNKSVAGSPLGPAGSPGSPGSPGSSFAMSPGAFNQSADADAMLRANSSFNMSSPGNQYYYIPENLNYISGEVLRSDGAAHLIVGVKLQPSVPGMTRMTVYRISGKTLVFHEWFRSFRELLHREIVQAMEDTAIVGDSELM